MRQTNRVDFTYHLTVIAYLDFRAPVKLQFTSMSAWTHNVWSD